MIISYGRFLLSEIHCSLVRTAHQFHTFPLFIISSGTTCSVKFFTLHSSLFIKMRIFAPDFSQPSKGRVGQKDIDGTCPVHVAHRRSCTFTGPHPGHKGRFLNVIFCYIKLRTFDYVQGRYRNEAST